MRTPTETKPLAVTIFEKEDAAPEDVARSLVGAVTQSLRANHLHVQSAGPVQSAREEVIHRFADGTEVPAAKGDPIIAYRVEMRTYSADETDPAF